MPAKAFSRYVLPSVTLAGVAGLIYVLWLPQLSQPDQGQNDSAESIFTRAQSAIQREDWSATRRLIAECLKRNPQHVAARLYQGQFLRDAGDADGALMLWQSIREGTDGEVSTARFLEACVFIERGRSDISRDLLQESLKLNPNYLPSREKLVLIHRMLRQPDALVAQLDQISQHRMLSVDELILRTVPSDAGFPPDETIDLCRATLVSNPADVDVQLALLSALQEAGRNAELLEVIAAFDPRTLVQPDFAAWKALALLKLGQVAEARDVCLAFADDLHGSQRLFYASGLTAAESGQLTDAIASLRRAHELDPDHPETCYQYGLLAQRLGLETAAQELLERSVSLDNLNRLCLRLSQEVSGTRQKSAALFSPIAVTLDSLNRPAAAADWYLHALQLSPEDVRLQSKYAAAIAAVATQSERYVVNVDHSRWPPKADHLPSDRQTAESEMVRNTAPGQIRFADVHSAAGLDFTYLNGDSGFHHLIESMGGGVIVIDFDGDDWPDLFFPQGNQIVENGISGTHTDRLFRNLRGERFVDVTQAAGLGSVSYGLGGVAGDFDNDGDDDLFVSNFGRNQFYDNNGDGTFTKSSALGREPSAAMSTSVAAADFDNDGLLDLYVANYVAELKVCGDAERGYQPCDPASFQGQADQLLRNDGLGSFQDVSVAAGIDRSDGKGLGVISADLDADGRMDVYVANDGVPNFLFRNMTPGGSNDIRFQERGLASGSAVDGKGRAQAGMGIATADFDRDDLQDLYVTNFYQEYNTLYANRGNLVFSDMTEQSQLAEPTLSVLGFGTQAADFDADGRMDLLVANGHIRRDSEGLHPWKMTAQIFQSTASNVFNDVSQRAGDYFRERTLGRGVALLDWNRDGRVDATVVHQGRPAALLENRSDTGNRSVTIRLIGTASNRSSVGATVRVATSQGAHVTQWINAGGYLSCNSRLQHFVIPQGDDLTDVDVTWPSGRRSNHRFDGPEVAISQGSDVHWVIRDNTFAARLYALPH